MTNTNSRIKVAYLLLTASFVLAFGLYRVHKRHQVIQTGYSLSEARTELSALREEENRLRLEESVLTSPERLESLASALGMVRPTPEQIRVLRAGPSLALGKSNRELMGKKQ